MRKVLLIGGAGYIGGYLTDLLLKCGHEVCVYDKLIYERRYLKDVKFIYGDIRNTERVIETAKDYDVMVIMAALVGDPVCEINPRLTNEINTLAVRNICERYDGHIIFLSTCSVYGKQEGILDENSPTDPLSKYAESKLAAEDYVRERNGTIFRLGTVYGIGDTHSRIRLDLVVNTLTMKAVYTQKINIYGGEQYRPLICVKDIAGYIEEAIRYNIIGTFILSYENVQMRVLAERIAEMVPFTRVEYTDMVFQDIRNYRVSNQKSKNHFMYPMLYNIEGEVQEMIRIFKENRIKDINSSEYNNGNYIKENLKLL